MKVMKAMAGALVALGLSLSPSALAGTILFDPDGAGPLPATIVRTFDAAPGNALAVGSIPGIATSSGIDFPLLYQARLSAVFTPGGINAAPGLGSSFQLTVVANFPEHGELNPIDPTRVDFSLASGSPNFFRMYFNPSVTASDAAGMGFTDGTLILEGFVSSIGGASFTLDTPQPVPLPPLADNNATPTLVGTGSQRDIVVTVTSFDSAFFPGAAPLSFSFRTESDTPFSTVDASALFFEGTTPSLGGLNGVEGPDFQFQTDSSFTVTAIPEPSTLTLLGVGLGFAGLARFARKRFLHGA